MEKPSSHYLVSSEKKWTRVNTQSYNIKFLESPVGMEDNILLIKFYH